jgi:hypothetical protein
MPTTEPSTNISWAYRLDRHKDARTAQDRYQAHNHRKNRNNNRPDKRKIHRNPAKLPAKLFRRPCKSREQLAVLLEGEYEVLSRWIGTERRVQEKQLADTDAGGLVELGNIFDPEVESRDRDGILQEDTSAANNHGDRRGCSAASDGL